MIITKNVSGGGWKTSTQKAETFAKFLLPPNSRNPNTGFRLFLPLIAPDFTQIPP